MRRIGFGAIAAFISVSAAAAALNTLPAAPPQLSAAEIVARNVAARGGLEAWRRIETMVWTGRVEGARGSASAMPFALELRRPNKTRFEVTAIDQRFTRIFDGEQGWRLRPGRGGAPEVKPFSAEEANYARDEFVIDGPLIDYQAKGVAVALAGVDELEGRKAYLLNVKLASGAERRVWIDAQTFLEVRSDRPSSNPLVKGSPVSVYYRDYRSIEGLQIPLTIESRSLPGAAVEKVVIDKVSLNPKLPDFAFAKPGTPRQRHAIVRVGGESSPPSAAGRPGP